MAARHRAVLLIRREDAVAEARIIDYYAILAVPPGADLSGIQNAYARLSDEVSRLIGEDDTVQEGILRLNEAYHVLSNPETRRKYDAVYFARDRAEEQRREAARQRSRKRVARVIIGVLALAVSAQVAALGYLARGDVKDLASMLLGPLFPGSAG